MPVTSLHICADHHPTPDFDQVCENCGSIFWTEATSTCEICKSVWKMPIEFHVSSHPEVVAFYHEHGIDFDLATYAHRSHLLDYREERLSDDPLRLRTTIILEGDRLEAIVNEQVNITEVNR